MKTLINLILLIVITGCASSGRRIDPNAVSQIQRGVTTRPEVLRLLGSPESMTTLGDGTTQMLYHYVRATTKGTTFIPIAGAFVGGSNVEQQMVIVLIGPDGLVREVSTTASAQDVNMGGSTPAPIPEVTDNKRPK